MVWPRFALSLEKKVSSLLIPNERVLCHRICHVIRLALPANPSFVTCRWGRAAWAENACCAAAVGCAAHCPLRSERVLTSSFFFVRFYQNMVLHLVSHHSLAFFNPIRDEMWSHIVVCGGCGCCAVVCLHGWAVLLCWGFDRKRFSDRKRIVEFFLVFQVVREHVVCHHFSKWDQSKFFVPMVVLAVMKIRPPCIYNVHAHEGGK